MFRRKTSNGFSLLIQMSICCFIWIFLMGLGAQALTCYDCNENDMMVETTNEDFAYCGILIERVDNQNYIKGKAFGVAPKTYPTEIYDKIFNLSNDTRKILTVCTLERYDFRKISHQFPGRSGLIYRCICNFDNCNREENFFGTYDISEVDSVTQSYSEEDSHPNDPIVNFCGVKALNVEKNGVAEMSSYLKLVVPLLVSLAVAYFITFKLLSLF